MLNQTKSNSIFDSEKPSLTMPLNAFYLSQFVIHDKQNHKYCLFVKRNSLNRFWISIFVMGLFFIVYILNVIYKAIYPTKTISLQSLVMIMIAISAVAMLMVILVNRSKIFIFFKDGSKQEKLLEIIEHEWSFFLSKYSVYSDKSVKGEIRTGWGVAPGLKYYDSNGVLLYVSEPDNILFRKSYTLYNGMGTTVGKIDLKYNEQEATLIFDLSKEMKSNIAVAFGMIIFLIPGE